MKSVYACVVCDDRGCEFCPKAWDSRDEQTLSRLIEESHRFKVISDRDPGDENANRKDE
jgi:hypothetical protein